MPLETRPHYPLGPGSVMGGCGQEDEPRVLTPSQPLDIGQTRIKISRAGDDASGLI